MKSYVILFTIMLLSCVHSHAMISNDSTVTINGQFLGNAKKYGSTISLWYYENYYGLEGSPYIEYNVPIKNGKFSFTIRNIKKFAYLTMMYDAVNNLIRTKSSEILWFNPYLVKPGTSVNLTISDDRAIFSGKGAEQLNCQYELYDEARRQMPPISKGNDIYGTLLNYKAQLDSVCDNQLDILSRYKLAIGLPAFDILKNDFESDVKLSMLRGPLFYYSDDLEQIKRNKAKFCFYSDQFLFIKDDTTASEAKLVSRSYGEFLLKKLVHNMDISLQASSSKIKLKFDQIYDQINQKYKGHLRDRLIAGCFQDYFQKREAPSWYIDDALSKVTTPEYYKFLKEFGDRLGSGKPAYNFSLPDSSGKIYTQEMLKGKLVILDFWFTGCGGCQLLNEKMKPIYNYYKDNPEVMFVTISIDRNLKIFKLGLKEGVYTHDNSLNLYTAGLKENHPIIQHYKIPGYPTMIIIGKDGRIITGSPPLPYTEEASVRFIRMIDSSLNWH